MYRAKMLAVPRFAVALGGISSGVVAATSVFSRSSVHDVSNHAFVVCCGLCGYFIVVLISGWLQHECARALSGRVLTWSRQRHSLRHHWGASYGRHLSDIAQFFRLLWSGGVSPLLLWLYRPIRHGLIAVSETLRHIFCLTYGLYYYRDGTRDHVTGRPNIVKHR